MGVSLKFIGDILGSVKSYTSFPKVWTTNVVFQLHCKVSALFLFASCMFVTAGQFFGDPIDCIVDKVLPSNLPPLLPLTRPTCRRCPGA